MEQRGITQEEVQRVRETIEKNIKSVIDAYPNTKFYLVIPPYHVSYFYMEGEEGLINARFDAEKEALAILNECTNAELYCYMNQYDITCNLDNYSDAVHYTAEINSEILKWLHDEEERITKDNYMEHVEETREFYLNYIVN